MQPVVPYPCGHTGRITDPNQFFDREDLLQRIFQELEKGSSVSLIGPEQIGKSSLLTMIQHLGPARLRRPIDKFIYTRLQWLRGEDDFFACLCDEVGVTARPDYQLHRALRGRWN